MSKFLFSLLAALFFLTACQKDPADDAPDTSTPTVANLSGSYKISKVAIVSSGVETDVTILNPPCSRDDIYKLNTNMSYEVIDAGAVCSPSNNTLGTWSLPNSTTIVIDGISGTIRKFDGKNLEIAGTVNGATGVVYYVKQ